MSHFLDHINPLLNEIILASESYFKQYEDDEMDVSYIEGEGKVVFLYYVENNCIGRIKIRSNWNGYALIEDIAVAKDYRQKGVGTAF